MSLNLPLPAASGFPVTQDPAAPASGSGTDTARAGDAGKPSAFDALVNGLAATPAKSADAATAGQPDSGSSAAIGVLASAKAPVQMSDIPPDSGLDLTADAASAGPNPDVTVAESSAAVTSALPSMAPDIATDITQAMMPEVVVAQVPFTGQALSLRADSSEADKAKSADAADALTASTDAATIVMQAAIVTLPQTPVKAPDPVQVSQQAVTDILSGLPRQSGRDGGVPTGNLPGQDPAGDPAKAADPVPGDAAPVLATATATLAPATSAPSAQDFAAVLAAATPEADSKPVIKAADAGPAKAPGRSQPVSKTDGAANDTSTGTTAADTPTQTAAVEVKAALSRVRSVLDALQPRAATPADTSQDSAAPVLPATLPDSNAAPAFSLQAVADTPGNYTADGASTASASNLSRATVDTLSALSMQISKRLSDGNTKFTLELHPADLGKVDVALTIGRDGKATAHLQFDTPVTASTFSSHEAELRQQLASTGLSLDKGALSFSSRAAEGSGDASGSFSSAFNQAQGQAGQQQPNPQSQSQSHARQAVRALQAADQSADETDLNAALDASLAGFRNRSRQTLALNVIV